MASSSPLYRSEFEPRKFSNTQSLVGDRFWPGFATGALIGTAAAVGGYMIAAALRGNRDARIVRFETSIQIGKKPSEVFDAWTNFEQLPQLLEIGKEVRRSGNSSEWRVNLDGKDFEWSAETIQFIPNEAIGWKSTSGPKHTGRINFAAIGDDTLMHVVVNYAPPLGRFSSLLSPVSEHVETCIEQALRDFKAALEGESADSRSGPQRAEWKDELEQKATGTYAKNKVDYTRPPEARYPISNPKISRD